MSGPEEVERLIGILSEGVRRKMMRPKCLARGTWRTDSDASMVALLVGEVRELRTEIGWVTRYPLPAQQRFDIADEAYDVAAFGAMLEDAERTGVRRVA